MRLERFEVHDHRTVVDDGLEVRMGRAVTVLVGPNLAGKSNLARALAMALDPALPVDLDRERPVDRPDAFPRVDMRWTAREHGLARHVDVEVSWPYGQRVVSARHGDLDDLVERRPVVAWAADHPADILLRVAESLTDLPMADLAADLLPTLQRVLPGVAHLDLGERLGDRVVVTDEAGFTVASHTVRATFAAAVAAHLVRRGHDMPAIIVEEPEVFLHPAAQEMLRDELLEVGVAADAPVVLTTESPFVVPRAADANVIAVARDASGHTAVVGQAAGDQPQATLLGGLFRDDGIAAVLDRTAGIPNGTTGVVVVEGGTDEAYLQLAAQVLGREAELEHVVVHAAGGALPAALHAIILRAETTVPVFVLLDNDDMGRRAKDTLTSRFGMDNRRQVTTYAEVIDDHPMGVEAEDMFDWRLVERFVAEQGDSSIRGKRILRDDEWHFDLTLSAKSAFVDWVTRHATPGDLTRWGAVLDLLAERLSQAG